MASYNSGPCVIRGTNDTSGIKGNSGTSDNSVISHTRYELVVQED